MTAFYKPCPHCGKYPVKEHNLSDLCDLIRKAEGEPDFPGEHDEYKRHLIIEWAVRYFDKVVMGLTDGSEEDTDILTSAVAKAFMDKVHCSLQSKLLRKRFEGDHAQGNCEVR